MGSLCSKGQLSGGHTVLGPASNGVGAPQSSPSDPRSAAAEAAERRLQAARTRGTNTSNPNHGRLAALANKPIKVGPETQQEERLVWD